MSTFRSVVVAFAIAMIVTLLGFGMTAFAQSGQYKKKSAPKAAAPVMPAVPTDTAKASATPVDDLSKKVDTTDLEQKYWAPKDTEFNVVQNRTYSKDKRFALTFSWGSLLNDQYSKSTILGATANYYLSERYGVEVSYLSFNSKNNTMTDEFISQYGTAPAHNKAKAYYGVGFNWIPIYAKVSLLEKKIMYFDLSITPGIGITSYDKIFSTKSNESGTAFTYSIDVAQHFFLHRNFAIRLDLKNQFYSEEVFRANSPYQSVGIRSTNNSIFLIGITYYH